MSRVYRRGVVTRGSYRPVGRALVVTLLLIALAFMVWCWNSAPEDLWSYLDGHPVQAATKAFHEFFPHAH